MQLKVLPVEDQAPLPMHSLLLLQLAAAVLFIGTPVVKVRLNWILERLPQKVARATPAIHR